jgi:hypothetical protein
MAATERIVRPARDQRLRQRHVLQGRAASQDEQPLVTIELEDLAGRETRDA